MSFRRDVRLVTFVLFAVSCSERHSPSKPAHEPAIQQQDWFTDRAREAGLEFVHFNGMTGRFQFPEVIPPGVALFDYDADGDLDVFVAQGQMLGTQPVSEAIHQPPRPLTSRLYRNDLAMHANGTRSLRFTDVTAGSGIVVRGYAMGAASGDIDNDGCVDLYVTNLERSQLFRNGCNGRFTDVSIESGSEDRGWSVSAAFVDYDRDGWLDLFVGNYVYYSVERDTPCLHPIGSLRDYCPPSVYRPQPSHLYHNDRDGTFTDVTTAAGMGREFGPALGVSTADFNGDGWIDIYVANDGTPNQMWINQRDGTFVNTALLAGVALGADGEAKASMGVDAGDFDHDGDEDLFITELAREGHDLYVNDGSGVFDERAAAAGIRQPSLPYTGFGTAWLDFDNDGWLDILTVNGAVRHAAEALTRNETFALQQGKQLFRNLGNGRFEDATGRGGVIFSQADVSRGAAFGDIDNDGDTDLVVANNSGPIRLLLNNVGSARHWVGVRVVGRQGRDAVGARVGIVRGSSTLWRRARADGSYASANDPRVLAGLGDAARIDGIRVEWPGGRVEEWTGVPLDHYSTLKEGEGR
jgi:hypothetical protein